MKYQGIIKASLKGRLLAAGNRRDFDGFGRQGGAQEIERVFGPGGPAHENVQGREAVLGPGMDADVGFAEQDDAGDPRPFPEMMKMRAQHLRAGRVGCGGHLAFQRLRVGQQTGRHAAKVGQHVAAGCCVNGHLWDPPDDQPDPPE